MKKRIFSLFLSICMSASLFNLPLHVNAIDTSANNTNGNWCDDLTDIDTDWYTKCQSNEFYISNAKELAGLAYLVNYGVTKFWNQTVYLNNDINLAGKDWIPIDWGGWIDQARGCPSFVGVFDGNGHTISNMTITTAKAPNFAGKSPIRKDEYYREIGLFGRVDGIAKNFNMKNAKIDIKDDSCQYIQSSGIVCGMVSPCSSKNTKVRLDNINVSNSEIKSIYKMPAEKIAGIIQEGYTINKCIANNVNIKYDNTLWYSDYDKDVYNSYTKTNTIHICTPEQLAAISALSENNCDFKDKTIELDSNIDMSEYTWSPIKQFNGTFHGNNHAITGLSITSKCILEGRTDYFYAGLFAKGSGTIQDLQVNVSINDNKQRSNSYYGAIIGRATGELKLLNCKSSGTISEAKYQGGIIGGTDAKVTMDGCQSECTITNNYFQASDENTVGGLIGVARNDIDVKNCSFMGVISAKCVIGGIIALLDKNVKYCSVENCINYNNIIRGMTSGSIPDMGGIIAYITNDSCNTTIKSCENYGDLINGGYCGGIVGYSKGYTSVIGCYNSGNIEAYTSGGIVGNQYEGTICIDNCTTSCIVSGRSGAGGILGRAFECTGRINQCGVMPTKYDFLDTNNTDKIATIISKEYTGGFVGYLENLTNSSIGFAIDNSYCLATLKTTGNSKYNVRSGFFNVAEGIKANNNSIIVRIGGCYFGGNFEAMQGETDWDKKCYTCYYVSDNINFTTSFKDLENKQKKSYFLVSVLDEDEHKIRDYNIFNSSNKGDPNNSQRFQINLHNPLATRFQYKGNNKFKNFENFTEELDSMGNNTQRGIWENNENKQFGFPYIKNNKHSEYYKGTPTNNFINSSSMFISGDPNSDLLCKDYYSFKHTYQDRQGTAEKPWPIAYTASGMTFAVETYFPGNNASISFPEKLFSDGDTITLNVANDDKTGYSDSFSYTITGNENNFGDSHYNNYKVIDLNAFENTEHIHFNSAKFSSNALIVLYFNVKFGDKSINKESIGESTILYNNEKTSCKGTVIVNTDNIKLKTEQSSNGSIVIENGNKSESNDYYYGNTDKGITVYANADSGYKIKSLIFYDSDSNVIQEDKIDDNITSHTSVFKPTDYRNKIYTVKATFEPYSYSVDFTGTNALWCNENGIRYILNNLHAKYGESFKFQIKANNGFKIDTINIPENCTNNNGIYEINPIINSVKISATAIAKQPTSIILNASPENQQARPNLIKLTASGLPSDASGKITFYLGTTDIGTVFYSSDTTVADRNSMFYDSSKTLGDCTFTASYSGNNDYNGSTSTPLSYSIIKGTSDKLIFPDYNTSVTYGDADFSMKVRQDDESNEVIYNTSDEKVAEINKDGTVKIVGTGTFTVSATKTEDNNYNQRTDTSKTITVAKKGLTIKDLTACCKTYDGNTNAVCNNKGYLEGVISGDSVSIEPGTLKFASKNANESVGVTATDFSLTGKDSANYFLKEQPIIADSKIEKAILKVSVDSVEIKRGQSIPIKVSIDGFISGEEKINGFECPNAIINGEYNTLDTSLKSVNVTYKGGNATDNYKFDFSNTSVKININPVYANSNDFSANYDLSKWQNNMINIVPNLPYTKISLDEKNWFDILSLPDINGKNNQPIYLKEPDGTQTNAFEFTYLFDQTPPKIEISYHNNIWNTFSDKTSFDIFEKEPPTLKIKAEDSLSSVLSIEYIISEKPFTAINDITGFWKALKVKDGEYLLPLDKESKGFVYIRATDNAGNTSIVNSKGIVIYTDSTLKKSSSIFNQDLPEDILINVNLHHNTICELLNGKEKLIFNQDYTINQSIITLKKEYILNHLKNGNMDITITFNPLGETYTGTESMPNTAKFTVTQKIVSPKTGDNKSLISWILVLLISSTTFSTVYLNKKKSKKTN